MLDYAWLVPLGPFAAFLIIVAFLRKPTKLAGYVAVAGTLVAAAMGVILFAQSLSSTLPVTYSYDWFVVGATHFTVGFTVDQLSALMIFSVTVISCLITIYSQGYMIEHDKMDTGYSRYFAFVSLFIFSMLGLVLSNSFVEIFIFWELVGLCSYLLIGHWFTKPEAAAAAKKAFIVTRLGDLGFLIGILLIWTQTGTFNFADILSPGGLAKMGMFTATIAGILVFCGAVGKSAQFPLQVWLPDAMEGPTPVSALIHAATMVAAGVYLVARLFPIYVYAPNAALVVAWIGGITAILAASMGLVMVDIKRVLAYSTLSQLGYMMMAIGIGASAVAGSAAAESGYTPGIFHLVNHAFFKALLFMGSGAVIHATETQDMRNMGGLAPKMKITAITFLLAALAISGIFPLSGFWSKDAIIGQAFDAQNYALGVIGLLVAFMTAFYMFRLWFLTFGGKGGALGGLWGGRYRGEHHPHEVNPVMWVPLALLAIPTVVNGVVAVIPQSVTIGSSTVNSSWIGAWLHATGVAMAPTTFSPLMIISLVIALCGIGLAWLMYGTETIKAEAVVRTFKPVHTLLVNKWYFDAAYNWLVGVGFIGIGRLVEWFDNGFVDGIVNGIATSTQAISRRLRKTQTGHIENYAMAIFLGLVVLMAGSLWFLAATGGL